MEANTRLIKLCALEMQKKGIYESSVYRDRFREEMKDINIQGEHEYFLELYDKRAKFATNQNNLMVPWLLGVVDEYDVNKPAKFVYGEFPDIDVDYYPEVRDWLKDVWAPETFGRDKVCSIGNYTTFGIKSAIIDVARCYGQDHHEILQLTTSLDDRDEDNKPVTWEKALEQNPLLKEYAEKYPHVAKGTQKLLNRSRGRGKHAGGLIISSIPLDNIVPLTIDKQGLPVSAWTEGMHAQDLGIVGLIKYDLLVVTNLVQIAIATQLIKDRHGNIPICALPGQEDWTDVDKFLDDESALKMADEGNLKCIFQFDSPGIRDLVRKGGVSRFDDLAAYSSLFRPGPLSAGMAAAYVNRKRGKEKYTIHPLLEPILGKTYGVMVYQEQVMKVLNVVGNIPLAHCEIVRKAISKKKVKVFKKYKESFISHGKKNLGWKEDQLNNLWEQIEAFAGYGFNKAHAVSYTYISSILLWLKTHYSLEFFSAILSCESQEDKIKEYRLEAEKCHIDIEPLNINKSGVSFHIDDNKIYCGFSHVKGIGKEISKRIVAGQPYSGFVDFLTRFGTDASVMKPIIGLGLFTEADRVTLWEFCEYFKGETKKRIDRDKRALLGLTNKIKELEQLYRVPFTGKEAFEKAVSKVKNAYRGVKVLTADGERKRLQDKLAHLHEDYSEEGMETACVKAEIRIKKAIDNIFTDEEYIKAAACDKQQLILQLQALYVNQESFASKEEFEKVIKTLKNSYRSAKAKWETKKLEDKPIKFEEFKTTGEWITDEWKELFEDDLASAQNRFYGFRWDRMVNKSPDYTGLTFEALDMLAETQDMFCRPVEVQVIAKPYQTISKKKNVYYNVKLEDGNGRQELVTIWKDEYERFKDEWMYWESDARQGNLLRVQILRPTGDFKKYTFMSWSRQHKHMTPKTKEEDGRLIVMRRP